MNKLIKIYNKLLNDVKNIDIEIKKLNLFDILVDNKLLLYEPIENIGFNLLIEYDYYNENIINFLLDCEYYGIIEFFKYTRELDDNFYITENIMNKIPDHHLKYLTQYMKIDVEKKNTKYDIIIITDIKKINLYKDRLNKDGRIIYIGNINFINEVHNMSLISPKILKLTGEYIGIYKKENQIEDNVKNKFFKKHIKLLNNYLKKQIHINKLGNQDIKTKVMSIYKKKLISKIINFMIKYNIPVKTNLEEFYNNKLLNITNKLYSCPNILNFQFINYENINFEIDISKTIYNKLNNISNNLKKIKRAIDTRNIKKWYLITFKLDNFKSLSSFVSNNYKVLLNNNIKVSNAFLKIYELLYSYQLFDIEKPSLKSFHFCEAPGMFILGMNHFIQTKTKIKAWDWYANSLEKTSENTALEDNFNIIEKYKSKWILGDIMLKKNIDMLKNKLNEVEFITSDCGICVDYSDQNNNEELISKLDYAQFINMINLLAINGSGIIKLFIPTEKASNVSLIYLATQLFTKVCISKPITSRVHNSEIYLVCIKFKGIEKKYLDMLINNLENFNSDNKFIKHIPISFLKQLEDYITDITRNQISYLLNIFYFLDNEQEINKIDLLKNNMLKNNSNVFWCNKFNIENNNNNFII